MPELKYEGCIRVHEMKLRSQGRPRENILIQQNGRKWSEQKSAMGPRRIISMLKTALEDLTRGSTDQVCFCGNSICSVWKMD